MTKIYSGTWTDDLDTVVHWTWLEHWEAERERRKANELREAFSTPHRQRGFAMAKREQVTVPLDRELREFVERVAEREDRSVAGVIRHMVAQFARHEQQTEAA